jgi:hypothetical protein
MKNLFKNPITWGFIAFMFLILFHNILGFLIKDYELAGSITGFLTIFIIAVFIYGMISHNNKLKL